MGHGNFHSIEIPKSGAMACDVMSVDRVEKTRHVGVEFNVLWRVDGHEGLSTLRMVWDFPKGQWSLIGNSTTGKDRLPLGVASGLAKAATRGLRLDFDTGDHFSFTVKWKEYLNFEYPWSVSPYKAYFWILKLDGKASLGAAFHDDGKINTFKAPRWIPGSDADRRALKELRPMIKSRKQEIVAMMLKGPVSLE